MRAFSDQKIPPADLEQLVEVGRFAPTARNVQPWEFVVVTDKQKLTAFAVLGENARLIAHAAACIVVFCSDTKYYLEDGCGATCNILLAATALGIGSCWIAGDKKDYCAQVCTLLHAPVGLKLVSLIALGYPQDKNCFKQMEKRPLKELLHWEKF